MSIERRESRARRTEIIPPLGRAAGNARVTGRAGVLLLVILVALAAGGLALAYVAGLGKGSARSEPAQAARPTAALAEEPPAPAAAALESDDSPRAAVAESDARAAVPVERPDLRLGARGRRGDDAQFDGRSGQIRGYIETADATPFPAHWRLLVEPSTTLIGRERAERREIEFHAGEQEFVVRDLPLAGYDLIAQADGMNARRHSVLLDVKHQNPYVTLQLYRAGYLVGRVLDVDGNAASDLLVTLTGADPASTLETRTDAIGMYRFDTVLDGEYTLSFGTPESPVLPPESLRFSAPSMTFPDRKLPELAVLDLLVLDAEGAPVAGAKVQGSGNDGGHVEVETDGSGRAQAHFLPAGRYRLTAEHELHGRARRSFDISGRTSEAVLRFAPQRP